MGVSLIAGKRGRDVFVNHQIKRKTKGKDKKYSLDYRKCNDENRARFSIIETINRQEDIFILINSSLTLVDHHEGQKKPFENRKEQQEAVYTLQQEGFRVVWTTPKYEEKALLFGVPMGKSEMKTRFILGTFVPKGAMSYDVFEQVLSHCDYMVGIGSLEDHETVYKAVEEGRFMKIDDAPFFEYTCVDSPFMKQCYTNYPWDRIQAAIESKK